MRHWSDWIPPICCSIGATMLLIVMFGDYCVVCGKIGHRSDNRWMERVPTSIRGVFSFEYTEEAKRELNRGTRTLPTFRLKDIWTQKFVQIEQ